MVKARIIYALIDYRGYFGSKHNSIPYNSGMDKNLLYHNFKELDFEVVFIPFSEVINYPNKFWKNKTVIYTSSEDTGYYYKSFIEDVVLFLELNDADIIPSYKYLRANNNKVFMELLRLQLSNDICNIKSKVFGCYEEAGKISKEISFPVVYKQAAGAMSKGVGLLRGQNEFVQKLKSVSRSPNLFREMWEYGRSIKYSGYKKESKYRKKFILQEFIPKLDGDYKVLVFSKKYFVLKRDARKNDFRASGSGIRKFEKDIPNGLLAYAKRCVSTFQVPNISLDIAFNGESFFLIEFQCMHFGSYTLSYSDFFWLETVKDTFILHEGSSVLEAEFACSIVEFCRNK